MAFSEKLKKKVKEKAGFKCCRCQSIGVDVHHIVPEVEGGPDIEENAAPLCPNCHDYYGDNPKKRKEIRQMRDWWYKQVERTYPDKNVTFEQLEQINLKLEQIHNKQTSEIEGLKEMLRGIANKAIDNITVENADVTASTVVNTSAAISAVDVGSSCPNCGKGRMFWERWGPSPWGFFTAWYKCSDCGYQFPSHETFDGG